MSLFKHLGQAGLAALLCAGAFAQAAEPPHTESRQRVGAHELSWECRGSGPQTVVLVAGMGLDVRATFRNTYRHFPVEGVRLCLYDRAGVGQSSPLQAARPLQALSDELAGLAQAQHWGPMVLVAHSFGGLVARSFALDHPEQVRGIVFVDAVHESWWAGMQQALSPAGWQLMQNIIRWERDVHAHEDFAEAVQSLQARRRPLPLPITVLSRGIPHTQLRQARFSYADVDAYNASWDVAQARLAQESSDTRQRRMHYASHLFDEQDPWLVIEEIQALLQRLPPRAD